MMRCGFCDMRSKPILPILAGMGALISLLALPLFRLGAVALTGLGFLSHEGAAYVSRLLLLLALFEAGGALVPQRGASHVRAGLAGIGTVGACYAVTVLTGTVPVRAAIGLWLAMAAFGLLAAQGVFQKRRQLPVETSPAAKTFSHRIGWLAWTLGVVVGVWMLAFKPTIGNLVIVILFGAWTVALIEVNVNHQRLLRYAAGRWLLAVHVLFVIWIALANPPMALLLGVFMGGWIVGLACLIVEAIARGFVHNTRPSLTPEPVPEHGLEASLNALDQERLRAASVGFEPMDRFYLSTEPGVVVDVFRHEHEPLYLLMLCLAGRKPTGGLVSYVQDGGSLFTSAHPAEGQYPRPPGWFLQIIDGADYPILLKAHRNAMRVLAERGVKPMALMNEAVRDRVTSGLIQFGRHIRRFPWWPARLLFWRLSRRCRRQYQQPLSAPFDRKPAR